MCSAAHAYLNKTRLRLLYETKIYHHLITIEAETVRAICLNPKFTR